MPGEEPAPRGYEGWLYQPKYADSWRRCPLYSLAKWTNGIAFRDIQFSATGKPVIKIAEIKNGISSQTKMTEQVFDDSVLVRDGDMLFAWSGQPETSIDVFWWHGPDGWLNQHVFRVTPTQVDRRFLYYLLKYLKPNFVGIARNKQTTGLGHVTKHDLRNIQGAYPDGPEQRALANILGALDDKIATNARMNATLRTMARTLFRSLFVSFDPVRDKSEGRPPSGMSQRLSTLFPSRFVDSELGPIPEGWKVLGLDSIAVFLNGLAMQKHPPREGVPSLPVIKIAQLRSGQTTGADLASADLNPAYLVADGDILLSWSGTLECVLWAGGAGVLNQHLFKVTSDRYPRWLYYLGIHEYLGRFRHIAAGKATTMGHIQRHHLSEAKLAVPSPDVLEALDAVMSPIVESLWRRDVASRAASAIRDALVPKLFSGDLPIGNVARVPGSAL
jgi:type I restriction enzyme S subunit